MIIKTKLLMIFAISLTFIFTHTACTQNKTEDTNKPAPAVNKDLAMNEAEAFESKAEPANLPDKENKSQASVYKITSIQKGVKGKASDFTWEENGKTMSFSEITKNKVVFLNFWGTWCPPCRREIPDIIKIHKELQGKDFIIIGIALERGGTVESNFHKVKKFTKSQGIKYMNFIDGGHRLAKAYGGIRSVPTTLIIDSTGNISETLVGTRSYNAFMQSINRVLK